MSRINLTESHKGAEAVDDGLSQNLWRRLRFSDTPGDPVIRLKTNTIFYMMRGHAPAPGQSIDKIAVGLHASTAKLAEPRLLKVIIGLDDLA